VTPLDEDAMLERTLATLVREQPHRARIFEHLGIDFCCHGDESLRAACDAAGLDVEHVLQALATTVADGDEDSAWAGFGVEALTDHIVRQHHIPMRTELPALPPLTAKVLEAHGTRHPELAEVSQIVDRLAEDLVEHIDREEEVAFPAARALAAGKPTTAGGRLLEEIDVLVGDHEATGEALARLRELTAGYEVPADGCASFRLLYERLAALEASTHLHVFKENSLLFPAASALAERAAAAQR
jgi:regulator of cell morphogenesis and NO signaling